jgi:hypothetical protein
VVTTRSTRAGEEDAMTVHHRSAPLTISAVLVAAIGWSGQPVAADDHTYTTSRVRSTDSSIAGLIDQASKRSPTFTRLRATIDASNGIVYVQSGACRHGVRACLKMWMTVIGSDRFMRIVVNRRNIDADVTLMASIGHELQHAIEVLRWPSITDGTKMFFFYKRHEPMDDDRFETAAAIRAGIAVGNELRRH